MVVWGCHLSWKTVTSSPGNRMVSAQPVGTSSHCMGTPKSRDQAVRRLSVKPAFFSSVFQGSDRAPKAFVKTHIIYTIPGVLVPLLWSRIAWGHTTLETPAANHWFEYALGRRRSGVLAHKILEIPGVSDAKAVIMESSIILSWHIAEGMCWSLVGS
jgi:hypothetical protein